MRSTTRSGAVKPGYCPRQHASEGYWVAELEADTTLTAEYLLLRRFLDRVDPERERKAVRYLRAMQLPDGGWPIFYGGPSEISASVKAYFALKLSGISADEPCHGSGPDRILAMGGVVCTNVFTKITLALFEQYDWKGIPQHAARAHAPAEAVLFQYLCHFLLVSCRLDPLAGRLRESAGLSYLHGSRALTSCISLLDRRFAIATFHPSTRINGGSRRIISLSSWTGC